MDEREPGIDDAGESEKSTRPAIELDTLTRQARSHNLTALQFRYTDTISNSTLITTILRKKFTTPI